MDVCFRGGPNPVVVPARASSGGLIFSETAEVAAGRLAARVRVQFSPFCLSDTITVSAVRHGRVLAEVSLSADEPDALIKADRLTLELDLDAPGALTFEGYCSANASSTHLRFFSLVRGAAEDAKFIFYPEGQQARIISSVVLGTTAVCNANCSHCPTNKAYSRSQAKGVMDTALFERIVQDMAGLGFSGTFMFGLFGDPLQDPKLPDRIAFIRKTCPRASIAISTNGALYDPARHQAALLQVDSIAVHIEAMTPEVYETHMRPLKVHRTFPRVERLLAENMGRVHIVSPVHRDNIQQVASLKSHWEDLGANETEFVALSNRSGKSPNYEALTLAPTAVGCGPEMVESELIIDWDGSVLTCCQDFHRLGKIGDMTRETVPQVLANPERQRARDRLNRREWGCLAACVGCKIDSDEMVKGLVAEKLGEVDHLAFGPIQFRVKGSGSQQPDGICVRTREGSSRFARVLGLGRDNKRSCTIFGPYRRVSAGRYRVYFDITALRADRDAHLSIEVVDADGVVLGHERFRRGDVKEPKSLVVDVTGFNKLEFRTRVKGLDALFTGVRLELVKREAMQPGVRPGVERAFGEAIRLTS